MLSKLELGRHSTNGTLVLGLSDDQTVLPVNSSSGFCRCKKSYATTHSSVYILYLPLGETFTSKAANVTVLALIMQRVGNAGYSCR